MGIGRNLKHELKEIDMTVAELSRKSGISTNTLYAIIRRDSTKVDSTILKKICEASGIPIYDLLDNPLSEEDFPYYDYLCAENELEKENAKNRILNALKNKEPNLAEYIMQSLESDEMFVDISTTYGKLNILGKRESHKRITELAEIRKYTDPDSNK